MYGSVLLESSMSCGYYLNMIDWFGRLVEQYSERKDLHMVFIDM